VSPTPAIDANASDIAGLPGRAGRWAGAWIAGKKRATRPVEKQHLLGSDRIIGASKCAVAAEFVLPPAFQLLRHLFVGGAGRAHMAPAEQLEIDLPGRAANQR
jgi:hypothetical protein